MSDTPSITMERVKALAGQQVGLSISDGQRLVALASARAGEMIERRRQEDPPRLPVAKVPILAVVRDPEDRRTYRVRVRGHLERPIEVESRRPGKFTGARIDAGSLARFFDGPGSAEFDTWPDQAIRDSLEAFLNSDHADGIDVRAARTLATATTRALACRAGLLSNLESWNLDAAVTS